MKYSLRLYVTGRTARSRLVIESLHASCNGALRRDYEIDVIDVLEHPQLAQDDGILVTPALVRRRPLPLRMVIGDLADRERVFLELGLVSAE